MHTFFLANVISIKLYVNCQFFHIIFSSVKDVKDGKLTIKHIKTTILYFLRLYNHSLFYHRTIWCSFKIHPSGSFWYISLPNIFRSFNFLIFNLNKKSEQNMFIVRGVYISQNVQKVLNFKADFLKWRNVR